MILYRPYHFCNLYKVLGVSKTDSTETIKEAYVKFAKEHHPDVNDGNQTNDFKEKTNAYNILKDPLKREQYNKTLQDESYHKQETKNSYYQSQQSYQSQSQYYEKRQYQHKQAEKSSQNVFKFYYIFKVFYNGHGVYIFHFSIQLFRQYQINVLKIHQNSTKDQPKSAQELEKLYNQSIREKEQSEIRRNNVVLSQENIQDSPFVIEQRRKEIEQEIIRKQFRIEVENYDKVQQGDRAMLRRKLNKEKTKTTKTILKTRHGDLTLEGFAKQQGVDIQKSKELDCFYFKPQSNEDNEEYM